MILGIDASNIRTGGGITHLSELLSASNPGKFDIQKIFIWASNKTLKKIPEKEWIVKKSSFLLNKSLFFRILWQTIYLSKEAQENCDILFLPAANTSRFHPYVSMCQNLLPFESVEKKRYGLSKSRLRLEMLKWNHCRSFRKADGVIFLSDYSINKVKNTCGGIKKQRKIYHGVSNIFNTDNIEQNKPDKNLNILYVSIINHYKHQDKVVQAVYDLLDQGYEIKLTLIGPTYPPALKKLKNVINKRQEYINRIILLEKIPYNQLPGYYQKADLFVFASSCETFGMIVLEAMAMGLPVLCSNLSSMKEVAGDAAIYFDPLDIKDIVKSIKKYLEDPIRSKTMSIKSRSRSNQFSWEKCADETLSYISEIHHQNHNR